MSSSGSWPLAPGSWRASTEPDDSLHAQQPAAGSQQPLLSVDHLTTGFDVKGSFAAAVIDVSFHVDAGETLCLVGESGSGKSVTALSIMRLVQPPGRIDRGRIIFKGRDLRELTERQMEGVRGAEISLIFQEPMTALNPVFTIGSQIEETLRVMRAGKHRRLPVVDRTGKLIGLVSLDDILSLLSEEFAEIGG